MKSNLLIEAFEPDQLVGDPLTECAHRRVLHVPEQNKGNLKHTGTAMLKKDTGNKNWYYNLQREVNLIVKGSWEKYKEYGFYKYLMHYGRLGFASLCWIQRLYKQKLNSRL
jgi:hypothetical protein